MSAASIIAVPLRGTMGGSLKPDCPHPRARSRKKRLIRRRCADPRIDVFQGMARVSILIKIVSAKPNPPRTVGTMAYRCRSDRCATRIPCRVAPVQKCCDCVSSAYVSRPASYFITNLVDNGSHALKKLRRTLRRMNRKNDGHHTTRKIEIIERHAVDRRRQQTTRSAKPPGPSAALSWFEVVGDRGTIASAPLTHWQVTVKNRASRSN